MSEKRLFYKDPATGVETPLLVYDVDTTAVSRLDTNKQDKTDNALSTVNKTVVGAINELKSDSSHCMRDPYVAGTNGQVLTSDGAGGYQWKDVSTSDVSIWYDPNEQELHFK